MPDWVRDMLIIFLGITMGCSAFLAFVVLAGIVREIFEDWKKRGNKRDDNDRTDAEHGNS